MAPVLPTSFIAGDTFSLTASLADYPAGDGWVLSLRFVPRSSGTPISITGTASGDDHVATVAAATTAAWVAGSYAASAWVALAGVTATVETGQLEILPDPRVVTALDSRSAAEVALDAARAALAAWSPTVRRYRINGREMEFNSPSEILPVISYWTTQVAREQAAAGLAAGRPDKRKAYVRIGRA